MQGTQRDRAKRVAPPGAKILYARRRDVSIPILVDDTFDHQGKLSLTSNGYVQMTNPGTGRSVLMHRWLLGLTVNDGLYGDHINGDIYDNRSANLRAVGPSESSANRSGGRGRAARRGVEYREKSRRWSARAKVDGKNYFLGSFSTADEAAVVAHEWREQNLPGYVRR